MDAYEFIFCLPALVIASAIGADRLPRPIFRVVIACPALIVVVHWQPAIQQLGAPTPRELFAATARALPEGAIVFSPVLLAPIMKDRNWTAGSRQNSVISFGWRRNRA